DRQVIVVPLPMLDLVAAVAVLERHPIDKADLAADHLAALQVGDVDPFKNPRRLRHPQRRLEFDQSLLWILNERFRLPVFLLAFSGSRAQRTEALDLIPQLSRPL